MLNGQNSLMLTHGETREPLLKSFSRFFRGTIGGDSCVNFVKKGEPIVWEIQALLGGLRDQRTTQKAINPAIKLATNLQSYCKLVASRLQAGKDVGKHKPRKDEPESVKIRQKIARKT